MLLGNISEIDILVTNFHPPSEIIEICKSNKIEIIVAFSPLDDENLNQNLG
jgi:DeoR/GlpR family transcriptional regulator of sugar metabolism